MPERPWFKFYPQAWLGEPTLKRVSQPSKALWIDLLCLMHQNDPPGCLTVRGEAMTEEMLARTLGLDRRRLHTQLRELVDHEVLSLVDGVLTSRKMVRDVERSRQFSELGRMGGNPTLKRSDKRDAKAQNLESRGESLESRKKARSRSVPPKLEPTPSPPPEGWEDFQAAYPRKYDLKNAEKEYTAALAKPGVTASLLKAQAAAYGRECEKSKRPIDKTFGPVRWLKDEHWRDEYEPPELSQAERERIFAEQFLPGWAKGKYWPDDHLGPEPGKPGCRIPPDLLAKYRLLPTLAVVSG